ncbi:MAG: hypothetical protein PHT77_10210 [Bacteroidales bacterium]|nr:hypothetical protein [Bacteroidales bacterium]
MERKHKKFWVIHENEVMHLDGYECPPNDKYWWFPEIQYSCREEYHVFNTENKALEKLLHNLNEERKTINKRISDVKRKLKKIKEPAPPYGGDC